MGTYDLVCLACGRVHADFALRCADGCNALLRARYQEKSFRPGPEPGLFKFRAWLPFQGAGEARIGSVVFSCETLARHLGVERLVCSFGGYWPERGAENPTGTFKDLEALPTILSFLERGERHILLASAGNTARAFAHAAQLVDDFTVFLVVPETMVGRVWVPSTTVRDGAVRLVAVAGSEDYAQAIHLADEIAQRFGIAPEGGARNVVRRDGLGTVMLEAARVLGRLPDHYFQAVGSGTGGIGAYEAALRLLETPSFEGQDVPRLHLSQNAPFLPIYEAWSQGPAGPPAEWPEQGKGEVERLFAVVLANRRPPYALRGGVADTLSATRGRVYSVTNEEAMEAAHLFARCEGIDLDPAAAVAVASLQQAVALGNVGRDELILLNLTGGGFERIRRDFHCRPLTPDLVLDGADAQGFESLL